MKTIIAVWGAQNIGKSTVVLTLANKMMNVYPSPFHKIIFAKPTVPKVDFRLILAINSKTLAFESMGDPGTGLNTRLPEIISLYNPDVLICTCRSKGYTVLDVENAAKIMGADIIWTSPYQSKVNHTVLNNLKSQHLLDLMVKLGLV